MMLVHTEGLQTGPTRATRGLVSPHENTKSRMSKTDHGHFESASENVENIDLWAGQYFSYERTTNIYHREPTAPSTLSGRGEIQFSVQGSWPGGSVQNTFEIIPPTFWPDSIRILLLFDFHIEF